MPELRAIETARAPVPGGHYSQAIIHQDMIFRSMQLPIGPSGLVDAPDAAGQAKQVIVNCEEILEAAGSSLGQVVSVTIFLAEIGDWAAVDRVFGAMFGDHRPARGVVGIQGLHLGARIGMQVVGVRSKGHWFRRFNMASLRLCFASFRKPSLRTSLRR